MKVTVGNLSLTDQEEDQIGDGALGAATALPSIIGGPGSDFTLGAERVDRVIDAVFG
jgi:hypothetical protein